jgi:hypothetical protein
MIRARQVQGLTVTIKEDFVIEHMKISGNGAI